jgi:hypothetical protein
MSGTRPLSTNSQRRIKTEYDLKESWELRFFNFVVYRKYTYISYNPSVEALSTSVIWSMSLHAIALAMQLTKSITNRLSLRSTEVLTAVDMHPCSPLTTDVSEEHCFARLWEPMGTGGSFWYIPPCTPLKDNWRFGGTLLRSVVRANGYWRFILVFPAVYCVERQLTFRRNTASLGCGTDGSFSPMKGPTGTVF